MISVITKMFFLIFTSFFFIQGCKERGNGVNKAEKQIEIKDLLGSWKLDSLNNKYSVLWFSPDSLIYVEHEHYRNPFFYEIDTLNNIKIDAYSRSVILYLSHIKYLDDSVLIIKNLLDIEEERVYKKFNPVGVDLWHYKEMY